MGNIPGATGQGTGTGGGGSKGSSKQKGRKTLRVKGEFGTHEFYPDTECLEGTPEDDISCYNLADFLYIVDERADHDSVGPELWPVCEEHTHVPKTLYRDEWVGNRLKFNKEDD